MTLQAREINATHDDDVAFAFVYGVEDAPETFLFWMADEARRMLQLGAFFYAVSIICQVPGGTHHKFIFCDDNDPRVPPDADDPLHWIGKYEPQTALDVLAECLRRLAVPHLMKQVPGAREYQPRKLSKEFLDWLDRHARVKDGLINLVAYCLDALILHPAEEEANRLPKRWHDWWAARTLRPVRQKAKQSRRKRAAGGPKAASAPRVDLLPANQPSPQAHAADASRTLRRPKRK